MQIAEQRSHAEKSEGAPATSEGVGVTLPAVDSMNEVEGELQCSRAEIEQEQARDPGLQDMLAKALTVEDIEREVSCY